MEKMRQEFEMLLVIWSILVVSLGTGFPTRHKSAGHKVSLSTLPIYGKGFRSKITAVQRRTQVSYIVLLNYIRKCFVASLFSLNRISYLFSKRTGVEK